MMLELLCEQWNVRPTGDMCAVEPVLSSCSPLVATLHSHQVSSIYPALSCYQMFFLIHSLQGTEGRNRLFCVCVTKKGRHLSFPYILTSLKGKHSRVGEYHENHTFCSGEEITYKIQFWFVLFFFSHSSSILGLRYKTECCATEYWVNLKDFSKHKTEVSSLKACFLLERFTEVATCSIQNVKRNPDVIPLEISLMQLKTYSYIKFKESNSKTVKDASSS